MSGLFLISLLLLHANARAGIIANGSFELFQAGADGGAGRSVYIVGTHTTSINGWTLSGIGDVYLHHTPAIGNTIGANFNFAQDGNTYLDLSGGVGGGTSGQHATMFQDFATVANQTYSLSFFSGAAFSPSATINVQIVGANPILNETVTAAAPGANISWSPHLYNFLADSSSARLSFRDLSGNDDNVSFVDNVSVTAVPEPSSFLLFAVASTAFGVARVRCQRQRKT